MTKQNMSLLLIAIKWVAPVIAVSVLAGVTHPYIDSIIILNGVFHEQQLLIIVVNVVSHAQLHFLFVFWFFRIRLSFLWESNKVIVLGPYAWSTNSLTSQ